MGLLPDLDLDLDLGPGRNPILGRGIGLIMAGLILGLSFRSGLSLGSHLLGYMSLNLRCLSVVWSSPSRSMSWTRSRIWSGAGSSNQSGSQLGFFSWIWYRSFSWSWFSFRPWSTSFSWSCCRSRNSDGG